MSGEVQQMASPVAAWAAAGEPVTGAKAEGVVRGMGAAVLLIWLLCLSSYSPAGRAGPLTLAQLDWIAIMKVAVRALAVLILGVALVRLPRQSAKWHTLWCLMPFGLYAAWAAASTFWSPLKAVSLGHAGDLFVLLLLAAVAGVACTDDGRMSLVLLHLALAMFLVSLLSTVLWQVGLGNRFGALIAEAQPRGFTHPNLAAQSAGGALLIVLAGHLVWRWPWARKMLLPAILAAAYVLYFAHSRTAIALTLLGIAGCMQVSGHRKLLLTVSVTLTVLIALYLAVDPYGTVLEKTTGSVVGYTMRGQTREQFASASGRAEMWQIGIESFALSPVIGHGNWVMTPTGMAFVWGEYQWETLHNMILHVLAGTGLIGAALFLWAVVRPLNVIRLGLRQTLPDRATAGFAAVVLVWFIVLGLYELSFLGPVSPVSVFYFVTVGLACARLRPLGGVRSYAAGRP